MDPLKQVMRVIGQIRHFFRLVNSQASKISLMARGKYNLVHVDSCFSMITISIIRNMAYTYVRQL